MRVYLNVVLTFILVAVGGSGMANAAGEETLGADETVVVQYFHGKRRCVTCRNLEKYAKETLDNFFAEELKNGKVQWRSTDVTQPNNRHLVEKYGLVSQSLVLVREKDGDEVAWKNLSEIWIKIRSESDYMEYVAQSLRDFMEVR